MADILLQITAKAAKRAGIAGIWASGRTAAGQAEAATNAGLRGLVRGCRDAVDRRRPDVEDAPLGWPAYLPMDEVRRNPAPPTRRRDTLSIAALSRGVSWALANKIAGKRLGRRLRFAKRAGDRRLYGQSRSNPKKGGPMSRSIVTKSLVAAAVVGLFSAHAATAQQTQNPPPTCTTHFVYFSTSSHALTPEDRNHIRDVAALMQNTPTFVATIVGKTDSVGSADFNAHLSQRRAEAVFEALVYANKVPENRVQLHWTGEHLPFTSTADEKAEAQNRMVAIIVSNGASEHCGG
jgi:hypothetical protein